MGESREMDGKLLAQAREEKENIRRQAMRMDRHRHQEVYARVPELRQIDEKIASLVPEAAAAAIRGSGSLQQIQDESLRLQAERAELLVANGWPYDYLDGAWSCPRCRDTGYVRGEMCSCLKKLYEKAQAQDLSALLNLGSESFETFDFTYYDNEPDPLTGTSARSHMQMIYGICLDYARKFNRNRTNLLFRGSTGLGKTFLSACIAREVSRQGYSVVYETIVSALESYENNRFNRNEEEVSRTSAHIHRMEECDLLILDDLGTEMITSFSLSALYTLINTRLLHRKSTVISTNLSAAQMEKNYTPQIVSRLEGEYQVLNFAGSDIRAIKKERGLA